MQLGEARHLARRPLLVRELFQRSAHPARQRLLERARSLDPDGCARDLAAEHLGIDVDVQAIARAGGVYCGVTEHLAEPRHRGAQRPLRDAEGVGQPFGAYRRAGVQREHGEQASLTGTGHFQDAARRQDDLHRAQDPDEGHTILSARHGLILARRSR